MAGRFAGSPAAGAGWRVGWHGAWRIGRSHYCRIDMLLSHQEIAHLVGASREAVSVALKELAEAGMIRTGFRTVAICRTTLASAQKWLK